MLLLIYKAFYSSLLISKLFYILDPIYKQYKSQDMWIFKIDYNYYTGLWSLMKLSLDWSVPYGN